MRALLNIILKLFEICLVICIAGLTGVTIAQVILRYIFNSPLMWAEELGRYLMIWAIMLGATIFLDKSSHVSVKYFVGLLPANLRRAVGIFVETMILALSLLLVFQGFRYALELKAVATPALGISKMAVAVSIPVCTVIWSLCGINNIYRLIRDGTHDEAAENP